MARRRPARLATNPTATATIASSKYADVAITIWNGKNGASASAMAIATSADTRDSTTAWSASAPKSVEFDVPVAFNTAKSRTRSSAVRYTMRAMIPAATIQSKTWMKSIDCLPLSVGRWRSALTSALVSTVRPAKRSRGTPFVITALARGCPANERFCASLRVMKMVWTPKLYRRSPTLPTTRSGLPLITTTLPTLASSLSSTRISPPCFGARPSVTSGAPTPPGT